jgi:ATP-dependent DNA ligase I
MTISLLRIVETWRAVAATRSRREKIALLGECLRDAGDEVAIATGFLAGQPRQGRIGVGWVSVQAALEASAAPSPSILLGEVDDALTTLAGESGPGSTGRRNALLRSLFERATSDEQEFLAQLLMGELRQGALEGIMAGAIAKASGLPLARVRRATMLAGRLDDVARAALIEGDDALDAFGLAMFQPLQPMLAQTADDPAEALERLGGRAAFEYKLDGARIQVHREGDNVRAYTRNLNDVTDSIPDIIEAVRSFPGSDFILDAEAIALRDDGSPLPFQTTMRRFGRKLDVDALRTEIPLRCIVFDCLRSEGRTLIDHPFIERIEVLGRVVSAEATVSRIVTSDAGEANRFLERARAIGHEGVMAKALDATWDAGARGGAWLKIKPVHTLDLVVLAAEWGHGRRQGWLSNLHLGARGDDGYVMLGKTFKGLTDEVLAWQTEQLLARQTRREGHIVHVRPELVVEIAFNDLQSSPRYPGGLALRFARVRAYRPDKTVTEADTMETVRAIHESQVAGGRDGA